MTRHYFQSIDGSRRRSVYPEGQDPLLTAWRAGVRETHIDWFSRTIWARMDRLEATAIKWSAKSTVKMREKRAKDRAEREKNANGNH